MARRIWQFDLEDGPHTVELDHSFWSTRRVIIVDDEVVVDRTPIDNLRHEYLFTIGHHAGRVTIGRSYWTLQVQYTLELDGRTLAGDDPDDSVTYNEPLISIPPIPALIIGALLIVWAVAEAIGPISQGFSEGFGTEILARAPMGYGKGRYPIHVLLIVPLLLICAGSWLIYQAIKQLRG